MVWGVKHHSSSNKSGSLNEPARGTFYPHQQLHNQNSSSSQQGYQPQQTNPYASMNSTGGSSGYSNTSNMYASSTQTQTRPSGGSSHQQYPQRYPQPQKQQAPSGFQRGNYYPDQDSQTKAPAQGYNQAPIQTYNQNSTQSYNQAPTQSYVHPQVASIRQSPPMLRNNSSPALQTTSNALNDPNNNSTPDLSNTNSSSSSSIWGRFKSQVSLGSGGFAKENDGDGPDDTVIGTALVKYYSKQMDGRVPPWLKDVKAVRHYCSNNSATELQPTSTGGSAQYPYMSPQAQMLYQSGGKSSLQEIYRKTSVASSTSSASKVENTRFNAPDQHPRAQSVPTSTVPAGSNSSSRFKNRLKTANSANTASWKNKGEW